MTTREILEAARDRIRERGNWHQGACFGGWRSNGRGGYEPTSYCAFGAIQGGKTELVSLHALASQISPNYQGDPIGVIVGYNDTHTHAEVLELFNLAIADEIAKEEAHTRHMAEEQQRELAEDPASPMVFA